MCIKGGDEARQNVMCNVRMWPVGKWGQMECATMNEDMSEPLAQEHFLEFVKNSVILEYGGQSKNESVDMMRVNSWLDIHSKRHPTFLNLGLGVCFKCKGSTPCLFGPEGIVQTPTAKLANLCRNLFTVNNITSAILPYLDEVKADKYSLEELDVQRLMNLFMVIREVWRRSQKKRRRSE